jgi:hypothetical protein
MTVATRRRLPPDLGAVARLGTVTADGAGQVQSARRGQQEPDLFRPNVVCPWTQGQNKSLENCIVYMYYLTYTCGRMNLPRMSGVGLTESSANSGRLPPALCRCERDPVFARIVPHALPARGTAAMRYMGGEANGDSQSTCLSGWCQRCRRRFRTDDSYRNC